MGSPEETAGTLKAPKQHPRDTEENEENKGGLLTDPPLGISKQPLAKMPSKARGFSFQEGGMDIKQEVLRPKRPPNREPTKGFSGGVRKSNGKCKQMAMAMEKWLKTEKSQRSGEARPERKGGNNGVKEGEREGGTEK